ncbi:FtsX-like permease family protein [Pseudoalteromonas rubra]|uniref:FtsX-like permease family protein n=1 Tax=Pseudoalteromonas rubra TaxID=43658 RepID=A0A5S3UVA1_9GAMM|nr:ABC transporter permease [Pseudoalteromonas rubra]MEC4087772.1 ABC transporter permease [Pseudoalteromonas rubra]QPB84242.1 FtsX-like permease family protein [Pseudoalteromonas rubra]
MLSYYFKLAWLSLRKTPLLSVLMVSTIALGIAAAMVTYTVSYMMTKDPLPEKSDRVFTVQLSSWGPDQPYLMVDGQEEIPAMVSYRDARSLKAAAKAKQETAIGLFKIMSRAEEQNRRDAQMRMIRTTHNDFFSMFQVPFLYGNAWSEQDDSSGNPVVVITKALNDELFGGANSVGRHIVMGESLMQIVGVMDDWFPIPRFYYLSSQAYQDPEALFVPLEYQINQQIFSHNDVTWSCWQDVEDVDFSVFIASDCIWLFYWAELESAEDRADYMDFINAYVDEQKSTGRFARENLSRLFTIDDYLRWAEVLSNENDMAVWLAFAFLLACLLNCMSLMMTKFYGKGSEIGLRRAVGASRNDICWQFLCEAFLIGILGGVLGLIFAQLGLQLIQQIFTYLNVTVMQMDLNIMLMTLILSVVTSVLFGLWPIYRAAQIQPSSQLKSL